MESLIRESDLRRMVIKMREKETCMETVTAAYVPTDEDFRLKSNAGEIGIDTNFASQNFWKDVLIRFFKKKSAVIGLIFIVLITVMVIIGPGMTPYTYSEQNLSQKNLAPRVASLEKLGIFDGSESISTTSGSKKMNYYVEKGLDNVYYWFGSDNFGRDILDPYLVRSKSISDHCCGSCFDRYDHRYELWSDLRIFWWKSRYGDAENFGNCQRYSATGNCNVITVSIKTGYADDHFCTDADGVGRHEQDCKGRDVKAERAGVCFSIKNTWCGKFLYYIQRNPAKHYRTDHYTGNVLDTDCYFYRGILKFRRTWNSGTAMFLRFIDLRGIQQLYNAFLPDHPADHRYGTLNVEL